MAKEAKELADQAGRIRELREERARQEGRRIPQPEVADAVGVTLRAYQIWEAGSGDIDPRNLKLLADYFDVTPDFIEYGDDGRQARTPNPFASVDALATLEQISRQVAELHSLLVGDPQDEEPLAGLADRLLQAAESPQRQGTVRPTTRRTAGRRKSA